MPSRRSVNSVSHRAAAVPRTAVQPSLGRPGPAEPRTRTTGIVVTDEHGFCETRSEAKGRMSPLLFPPAPCLRPPQRSRTPRGGLGEPPHREREPAALFASSSPSVLLLERQATRADDCLARGRPHSRRSCRSFARGSRSRGSAAPYPGAAPPGAPVKACGVPGSLPRLSGCRRGPDQTGPASGHRPDGSAGSSGIRPPGGRGSASRRSRKR